MCPVVQLTVGRKTGRFGVWSEGVWCRPRGGPNNAAQKGGCVDHQPPCRAVLPVTRICPACWFDLFLAPSFVPFSRLSCLFPFVSKKPWIAPLSSLAMIIDLEHFSLLHEGCVFRPTPMRVCSSLSSQPTLYLPTIWDAFTSSYCSHRQGRVKKDTQPLE